MEKQRLLYDIDTVAIWTPNDNHHQASSSSNNSNNLTSSSSDLLSQSTVQPSPLPQQLAFLLDKDAKRKLSQWRDWLLRRVAANISPLFLTTTVPSGLASTLTPLKSAWQIALSPDSQFLAVNHEDKLEFRTLNSDYQIVHALYGGGSSGAKTRQDLYPKWRKIAWSLDSKLIARSFSDGTVEIVDIKGRLIGTIIPKDHQPQATEEDLHTSSHIFVEPLSYLGFVNVRRGKSNEGGFGFKYQGQNYAYELVTITFDGTLRSYLFNTMEALDQPDSSGPTSSIQDDRRSKRMTHRRSLLATQSLLEPRQTTWPREGFSDPGFFVTYHKFTFRSWFRTVACASVDEKTGILCIGGALLQKKDAPDANETQPGVMFWAIELDAPYYKRYKSDGSLESSVDSIMERTGSNAEQSKLPAALATVTQTLHKLAERDTALMKTSVHTIIVHEKHGVLSLDGSGTLTSWTVSQEQGGKVKMSWDSDHLNYYARSKEHSGLSFQQFQDLVKEYQSNGTSVHLIGVLNGRCVSMRFWTKDAILLGYESGAMIVLQIPELVNILGQEPKVFASCLEFTNSGFRAHDEQVFVIEEITRMIRARVVGERWIMMSEQEDKALGEPTEEEIAQMMGNEGLLFKWVAQLSKYFESKEVEGHRAKRQKLILVPKRTLSLYRLLRVPPEELLHRKLESREFSSALSIANTYELDTDTIYQYQWRLLTHFSADLVADLLGKITDKEWVLASCLDTPTEDHESIRTLLEYGLRLTDGLMDDIVSRCSLTADTKISWIRAAASGEPMTAQASKALQEADLSEQEIRWCQYRWYFFKYLNRLSTYLELTKAEADMRAQEELRTLTSRQSQQPGHDPLDPLAMISEDTEGRAARNRPTLTGSYAAFRDVDLAGQGCLYAEAEFIQGIRTLFTRHNRETWPWRLAIVGRIPEACPTALYRDVLSRVDSRTQQELPWTLDHPWRDMDWVEVPEFRKAVFGSPDHEMDNYLRQQAMVIEKRKAAHGGDEAASLDMVAITKEAEQILPSPTAFPAPNEVLSDWFIHRALEIDRTAGQMIEARRLVQCGTDNHIQNLEGISEDLGILCKLLYEIKPQNRSPQARELWTNTILDLSLERFSLMDPMQVVQLCLSMSDDTTVVSDIRHLVLPYLTVIIPRRWQRHDPNHAPGQGLSPGLDARNPMSYLYAYLLSQSPEHLAWVGAVVEASKPVYEPEERIISNDMDLSWLTLSCMYGCRTVHEWKVMSNMIVCLPMFDQTEPVDETVDRLDPLNMYPAFVKYAPTPGLMQHALDTLERHLTAAETLARYDLPVRLSWFLENSDSGASQQQMITRMARLASGGPEKMGERFESDDEWMLLLEDLLRLREDEQGGGVMSLVSEQDIYREYLAGVLSCGKFELAKAIIFPPGLLPPLRLATAEKLVIDCSNEMYNNATSGNRHQGLMKMAYDCLKVLPETTNIRREMDLIEATNFMTSTYKLTAPGTNTVILPLQIRSTENRLSLVRRLIMTQENAYRDHEAMLELALKITGVGPKKALRQQVEIQIVVVLIEAALKERNHVFALQQSDRLMDLLRISGAVELTADGSPKIKRVAKSSSFNSTVDSEETGAGAHSDSRPDSPSSISASQPGSRSGTSMSMRNKNQGSSSVIESDPDAKKPWEIFVQVGTESEGRDYNRRMAVVGYALACCPPEKLESVLELWRTLEMESLHAPVPEVDPRRGVAGFMSTMMDRSGSGSGTGISSPSAHQHHPGYNPDNRGPLSEIIGRAGTGSMLGAAHQDSLRRENTSSPSHHDQEGGRRRDKLKSLVSSIWATTAEFKAAVNSLLSRGQLQNRHGNSNNQRRHNGKEMAAYSEFSHLATSIGKDITETNSKLQKLTKLVKRKAMFDDRPVEISELTHHIKQDLSRLNAQILALQQHVRATAAKGNRSTRQMDEHSGNVVIILQSKLANTSMGFKEALEIRTESMQATKKRQDQLLNGGASHPGQGQQQPPGPLQQQQQHSLMPPSSILSPLRNNSRSPIGLVPTTPTPSQYPTNGSIPQHPGRTTSPYMQQQNQQPPNRPPSATPMSQHSQQYSNGSSDIDPYSSQSVHRRKGRTDNNYNSQYEDDNESAGPASMLFQQQQHAPNVEEYVQTRSTAIEAVESTLQELGGIFQQLAQMVAEQRDTVQRIEANTDDIELNINEAQNQLLRYYRNLSSDRWLMIKVFLAIIFVFLVVSLVS
ncbi:hypothetical protein BGZ83_004225 [Gryganskiella cystojenkinii]|nr:hypothetical protein BGZ83_004225 [Gryganskiella cystojenkinii]